MKRKPAISILVFLAMLLLASSSYGAVPETKAALAEEDFIFAYTFIVTGDAGDIRAARIDAIGDMMGTGMTHVVITFWPTVPKDASIQEYMDYAKNNGYKLALEISAGMCPYDGYSSESDNVCLNSPELFEVEGDHGNQYLKAPCLIRQDKCIELGCTFSDNKCQNCPITSEIADHWSDYVDTKRCEKWNSKYAIDPSYTGPLWQNTLKNTAAIVARAKALNYQQDIVLFDTEIWENPKGVESLFNNPSKNCGCNIIQDGITEAAYYDAWKKRGQELTQAVKNVDNSIKVNFYNELPAGGTRWIQEYNGRDVSVIGYMPSGTGDFAGPSLYVLPNLELLEKNISSMSLPGTLPRISPTYMYGYSNFFKYRDMESPRADALHFDTSVSREAGRMLREAGTRGFSVYPNAYTAKVWYGDEGYAYWLAHATALIAGFKEGADYVERNKIRNPDFEAFKTRAPGFDWSAPAYAELRGSALKEPIQFAPVFWTWVDSNPIYKNRAEDANISQDKESGMYSWRHTRTGDKGTRTIHSRTFKITSSETGNYSFSIQTKASLDSSNSTIAFSLVNTNTPAEQPLGETGFATEWKEFNQYANMAVGDYNLKIVINDQTGQTTSVFLDNASFEKATACGNGECEAELGETLATCQADCKCGNGTVDMGENCSSCPADVQCETGQECLERTCTAIGCISQAEMNAYLDQWKRGEISMLTLMQNMRQYKTGTGCQ